MFLFFAGSARIQRQVISLLRRILPEVPPARDRFYKTPFRPKTFLFLFILKFGTSFHP
jgi:hypothetical protein